MINVENAMFLAMDFVKFNEKGQVTMGSAGFISLFSMAIVFIVLLIISYLIDILHAILSGKKKEKTPVKTMTPVNTSKTINKSDDGAIVAVIAAAVATILNTSVDNVKICSIRRIGQDTTSWSTNGLMKQVTRK